MPAYVLVDVDVTEPEKYRQYLKQADVAAAEHGARFLARGGAIHPLEGGWTPRRIAILEFKDVETAKTWYDSHAYREARGTRAGAARFRAVVVEGLPAAP